MPTVAQIRPIKKASEPDLLKLPGVTGVAIAEKVSGGKKTGEMAIVVYVEKKRDVPAKDRVPKEIQGVKTDVVQRRFKPNALVPVEQLRPAIDATRYTQLRGGMSVGPCRSIFLEPPDVPAPGNYTVVGTLGAVVRDNGTDEPMLLTNFHVAAVNDGWSSGDAMAQPGRPDGGTCPADTVGELARAVVQGTTGTSGAGVDGAVIRLTGTRTSECSIIGIGTVTGTAVATEGMAVRKRGRTTELTFGTVSSTDLTVSVNFGDGIGTVVFQDQIEIEVDDTQSPAFGISGDSGSVIVNETGRVVGLYFAGNIEETDDDGNVIVPEGVVGVANPIAAVESALNVSVCTGVVKKLETKEAVKEFKEIGEGKPPIKELIKDSKEFKEFKEFGPKEFKEFGPKEFKEPKEIFEDKRFEEKRFEGGPGLPPGLGQPPGGGFPGLEDRLRRIEAALGLGGQQRAARPAMGLGCIDFATMPVGPTPNPLTVQGVSFLALDHVGALWPNLGIKTFGAVTGLDAGFRMEITLPVPCPQIRITLAHFSAPPTVEAFDAAGMAIGSKTVTAAQGVPETITLPMGPVAGGAGVSSVVVTAPQNETLITEFCCLDGMPKPKPEKAEGKDKLEKFEKPEKIEKIEKIEKPEKLEKPEFKDKFEKEKIEKPEKPEKIEKPELKDKPEKEKLERKELPKELKEDPKETAPKELKEGPKEGKEIKEDPKEFGPKEFKEFEPKRIKETEPKQVKEGFEGKPTDKSFDKAPEGGGPGVPGRPGPGGIEERLARIEAALSGQSPGHFIDPSLRPDLSSGALRREPDASGLGEKTAKDAHDAKQSKDLKDSEKPSDG